MPISMDRERRSNAGSRMARLLNEVEEDEFYSSAYGGFTEENEDADYESESSVEDIVDSDFIFSSGSSTSDEQEGASDEDAKKRRTTNRVITKNYKEPKRTKTTAKSQETKQLDKRALEKSDSQTKSTSQKKDTTVKKSTEVTPCGRPTLRPSTVQATAIQEGERNRRRSEITSVQRKAYLAEMAQSKNLPEVRRLTQEELLAEAKITEEINRRSLARYQRLEVEKKKARLQKTVHSTPMIRYHSFTVPLMEEQSNIYGVAINHDEPNVRAGPIITDENAKCSRNLVVFADDHCLRESMPKTITPLPEPGLPVSLPIRPTRRARICPISGLPAPYLDPLTLTPYANLAAFRVLRHLYALHLETNTPPMDLLREYRHGR